MSLPISSFNKSTFTTKLIINYQKTSNWETSAWYYAVRELFDMDRLTPYLIEIKIDELLNYSSLLALLTHFLINSHYYYNSSDLANVVVNHFRGGY